MGVSSRDSASGVDVVRGVPVGAAIGSGWGVAVCWEADDALSVVAGTKAGGAVAVPSQAISREERRAAKTIVNSAKGWRVLATENFSTLDLLYLSRFSGQSKTITPVSQVNGSLLNQDATLALSRNPYVARQRYPVTIPRR